ncbi:MAG: chemotaxis protein CheX [Deferribacteraceae bacterium]|jgi:chemotaxis protein CheX|nr:chemotaxis protein CheX [Deferribacteraceae bacterium]
MKAETINPFITATINVFETMTGVTPQKGDIYVKQDDKMTYDISGVIGIAGKMQGFIVLSFPEALVLEVVSGFLGEKKTRLSKDVIDAVGEFVNMIAGSSKRTFAEQGMKYNIGIPSVITGKNHIINRPSNVVCIGVKFFVGEQHFVIEVALKSKED